MEEAEKWNRNVSHPLQSWEWGEFRAKRQPVSRIAGMQIIWTKVPLTPWYFGYIPMGKMPSDQEIKRLSDEGKRQKAIGIRVEPNVVDSEKLIVDSCLVPGRNLFKKKTIVLDLTKSEEELLKGMHPKGRYNIKVAQKHNVSVRVSLPAQAGVSQNDFEKYLGLMFSGTAKRQGIYAHSENYHRQMWEALKGKMAHLWVAEYQGKTLVADIVFGFGDTLYYAYGASALEHKEVMAPTVLLWEVARWGKLQGFKKFDLWGAEEGKGFTRFKEQFGGKTVELAGSFDLPVNKYIYPLFRIIEEVRWKILRAMK